MPEFTSPRVEEFYNHVHDSATGRFSGRAASGREGFREGSHSTGGRRSSTLKPTKGFVQHRDALKNAQARADAANRKMAEVNENRAKYGQLKSGGSARQTAARAGTNSQTTHVRQDGTHGNRGGPVLGPKKPLYNAVTGRLNQRPAHDAFKQGMDEIIRPHKEDSKRTTLTGGKVRTVGTYKGRVIKHISSKGGKSGRPKFVNPLSGKYVK